MKINIKAICGLFLVASGLAATFAFAQIPPQIEPVRCKAPVTCDAISDDCEMVSSTECQSRVIMFPRAGTTAGYHSENAALKCGEVLTGEKDPISGECSCTSTLAYIGKRRVEVDVDCPALP